MLRPIELPAGSSTIGAERVLDKVEPDRAQLGLARTDALQIPGVRGIYERLRRALRKRVPRLAKDLGDALRVEVRFEDGDRIELTPKEGYLVWPIPSRHYPRGHRLNELIAFDASGRRIARRRLPTNGPGLYPCSKPESYGYGVSMCP